MEAEADSGPCQASVMEIFYKNSQRLSQSAITLSKLTTETLEQAVKH